MRYCTFPQAGRPLTLFRPATANLGGRVLPDPPINEETTDRPPSAVQSIAMEICCVAVKINCRVQTAILALDMLRRIAAENAARLSALPKKVLAPALLTMAIAFFDEHIIDFDILVGQTMQASPATDGDAVVTALSVSVMACEVLVMLHGQVFHRTYWDYLVPSGDVPMQINQLLGMLIYEPFRTQAVPVLAASTGTSATGTKDMHMSLVPRTIMRGDALPTWTPLPNAFGGIPRRPTESTGKAQLSHVIKQLSKLPGTDEHVDRHRFHYVNRLIALRPFWYLASPETSKRIVDIFTTSPNPVMHHLWKWVGMITA